MGFAESVEAATYYVDATGGLDSNSGLSEELAWQTLSKVQTRSASLQPGDSVLFKRGEMFTGSLNIGANGSAVGGHITFADYGTGSLPIINSNSTYAIRLSVRSYITLRNLHVQNGSLQNILLTSTVSNITINNLTSSNGIALQTAVGSTYSNILVDGFVIDASSGTFGISLAGVLSNFTLTNISESGGTTGLNALLTAGSSDVTISNSLFNSNAGRGVRISNITGLTVNNATTSNNGGVGFHYNGNGSDHTYNNLTSTGNTGGGLFYSGGTVDTVIVDNSILSSDTNGNGLELGGTGTNFTVTNTTASSNLGGDGFNVTENQTNVIFEFNIAENNGTDGSGADGDGFTFHDNSTGIIRYNISRDNKKSAIAHIDASSVQMYYNLFYHTTNGTIPLINLRGTGTHTLYNNVVYSGDHIGTGIGLEDAVTVNIQNNIVNGFDIGILRSGGNITNNYNLVYGAGSNNYSGITAGANSKQVNPIFIDANGNDFTLASTSTLINAGTSTPGFTTSTTTDFSGNPIYGTPDIGAYEYQPPYTITTDHPQYGSNIRIYGDGKYRYTTATTSSSAANLSVTPVGGYPTYSASTTRPEYLNISDITWGTSKQFTASSSIATSTIYTIGDLTPNTYYTINYNHNSAGTTTLASLQADQDGKITFTYTGGYSTVLFDISPVAPTTQAVTTPTTPTSHSSSGGSTQSQVNNLIAMGNYTLAGEIAKQYGITIPSNTLPQTTTKPNPTNSILSSSSFTRNLKLGMKGLDVKLLQQFLNNNGFPVSKKGVGSKGRENTTFGPATKAALVRFQKANKITPAVGYFGPKTQAAISKEL